MTDKTIGYARISTEQQDLQRQLDKFDTYQLDSVKTDVMTGTNTERESWQYIMSNIDEINKVVVSSVSRVSRSISDLHQIADQFKSNDTILEFIDEPITITNETDPFQKAMFSLLGTFAELEADLISQRTKQGIQSVKESGKKWGRAPIGYTKENGELFPEPEYEQICYTLQQVDNGDLSKRKASNRIEPSRATIRRILDNEEKRELYNLD